MHMATGLLDHVGIVSPLNQPVKAWFGLSIAL
jgi:hypothetical protein